MVSERCRDAHRPIKVGRRIAGRSRLGALDRRSISRIVSRVSIDAHAVIVPTLRLLRDAVAERIEQAGARAQRRPPTVGAFAFAEEALEYDTRMRFGGQRGRWR